VPAISETIATSRTENGDLKPVPQALSAPVVIQKIRDIGSQTGDPRPRRRFDVRRKILVGKIDPRLGMGQNIDQIRAPGFQLFGQAAAKLRQSLQALGIGFRIDQIGDRLGFRQVDLSGQKGPFRKLSGLRQAQAGECGKRFPESLDRRPPAVRMELCHILAGEAGRSGKPHGQPVIKKIP